MDLEEFQFDAIDSLEADAERAAYDLLASLKHVRRRSNGERTRVHVNGVEIGGDRFVVMAGPCAVESERQVMATAEAVARAGARVLRGGGFKPRTSPYAFQGLGLEALKLLRKAGDAFGLPVVSEAMSDSQVELVAEYADIVQVGTRSMENAALLAALGRCRRPVLLKRGMVAPVEELLQAAEALLAKGNPNVILCERGIRTFGKLTRNTCDIVAVPLLHQFTHLPVIVDPSHATGRRSLVPALARAAVAIGADGLLVEVHPSPKTALSDGVQSLSIPQFNQMMQRLKPYFQLWTDERALNETPVAAPR
ncbi:MAG: 3-deoxy-7-phosphoheptulonate synthase [Acidobacteriia bacterium]|nr:3-deoxy-7-phosphoheptulonate synthase [Terriglobia bacterium]